jgi:hypothetical protein
MNEELNVEENRLKTFDNWNISFIDKHQLARYGFYYYGPSDLVRCFFCHVEIGMWEEGDDVLTDHIKWSPRCSFIRSHSTTNNVPIDQSLLNESLSHLQREEENFEIFGITSNNDANEITSKETKFPEFAIEARRIESYKDWPIGIKQKPQELSNAGFFYTGKGDKILCFKCGGGFKDWEENDDPWEEHAKWYPECKYLNLMKGIDYIQNISKGDVAKTDPSPSIVLTPIPEIEENMICKICFVEKYNTIFIPCGHVIACAKCASSVTTCPACREPFEQIIRAYFS